jgi:hypothetical protein
MPRKTRAAPTTLLKRKLVAVTRCVSARIELTVSRAKLEKVVIAPRYPVTKKRRIEGVMKLPRSANAKERPMRKQPERLTMRVPHGNLLPKRFTANSETPYRDSDPRLPPTMTKRIFIVHPSVRKVSKNRLSEKLLRFCNPSFV